MRRACCTIAIDIESFDFGCSSLTFIAFVFVCLDMSSCDFYLYIFVWSLGKLEIRARSVVSSHRIQLKTYRFERICSFTPFLGWKTKQTSSILWVFINSFLLEIVATACACKMLYYWKKTTTKNNNTNEWNNTTQWLFRFSTQPKVFHFPWATLQSLLTWGSRTSSPNFFGLPTIAFLQFFCSAHLSSKHKTTVFYTYTHTEQSPFKRLKPRWICYTPIND